MPFPTFRATLLALALAAAAYAAPPTPNAGIYALPNGQAYVSATLAVTPGSRGAQPGTFVLDVAMTLFGANQPVTSYEVELSKRLHLIAISDDFRIFLHEHGERPGADGHFRILMTFPKGGVWHIYADTVPDGLGQQVMRFDLNLDSGGEAPPLALPPANPVESLPAPPAPRPALPQPTGLEGSDGRYGVRFNALDLRAGQEAQLALQILRDGKPAPDLTPFLGVAAHAVFIDASDLTYVHVHAAPAASSAAGGTAVPRQHDMIGMAGTGHQGGGGHGGMVGMGGSPLPPGAKVSPSLTIYTSAPKAGTYLLWLQFRAGGRVRTVPFVVAVT